ncbi:SPOR domain-containing protein [Pararhodobacter sp.]|uniref:SPOR domain-containing protein n=1 Tax=Pararhodobacter sp. TaxID=2127056 RepID=UPI002AFF3DFA|nr:SPOR domain-containing protein [Pararhodobacter sp.]
MAQLHYEAYRAPQHSGTPQHPAGSQTYPYQQNSEYAQAPVAAPPRVGRFVNLVGALVSMALVTGVGIWSYRLMVRDVSGVPVIRALAGPYRVTPDDPGGLQASYQGLAVNNVAAEGNAADAAQTIALAPPPVQLSAEDRAVAALVASTSQPIAAPSSLAPVTTPPQQALIAVPGAEAPQAVALDLVPASLPGISRSRFPRARPGGGTQLTAVAAAPSADTFAQNAPAGTDAQAEALLQELVTRLAPSQVTDIDPDTLAPGTRLVQLGAYDSDLDARAAWDNLAARFPAYLENRGRIIESASAGGRTFYRLRAHGFSDEPEARRFCSVFLADNADCIPVLIR